MGPVSPSHRFAFWLSAKNLSGRKTMRRREFIRNVMPGVVAAGTAGALSACAQDKSVEGAQSVQTQKNSQWRLASSFPRGLDTIFGVR